MNENFSALFLDSLKDGTYNDGLREKLSSISRGRHKSLEDSIYADIQNQISPSGINPGEEKIGTLIDTVRLSTLGSLETTIPIWIQDIIYKHIPEESEGNLPYYPPVREYTIPEGSKNTSNETARIHAFQNNAFIQHAINISKIPIPTEEMNRRLESIYNIHPGLLENTIIHEVDVDLITGFIQTPICTIPETMIHVGYMVGILVPSDGTEPQLTQIYIYKNATLISKLLEFLRELKVSNTDDLKMAQEYLQTISV